MPGCYSKFKLLFCWPHKCCHTKKGAPNLYAIRIIKAKGLNDDLINSVFQATVISRLCYASQFWWGFLNSNEKERLEALLRKALKCNFYNKNQSFKEIVESADQKLFNKIIINSQHVLHPLLTPIKQPHSFCLRPRSHNFTLPPKSTSIFEKNFIVRMLGKDCLKISH